MIALAILSLSSAQAFELRDGGDALEVFGRVRTGWTARFVDDDDHDHTAFLVDQARLGVGGALAHALSFEVQVDLAGGGVNPKDLWIGWSPSWWVEVRAGQQKVPVSWDRLQSMGKFAFAARPSLTSDLVPGRDIGVLGALHSDSRKLSLQLGAFTGRGDNVALDDEAGMPLLAGRLQLMPLAEVRAGHGDVRRTGKLAISLALNGSWTEERADAAILEPGPLDPVDGTRLMGGGDAVLKYRGLFLEAELLQARATPFEGDPWISGGYLLQGGYYCDRLRLEPSLRFEDFNPSDTAAGDRERTLDGAISLFPTRSHDLKITADYRHRLPREGGDMGWKEDDLTVLAQLAF
ncbi:MAG: hypothetical protein JXX28_19045 [Deltaproteobacteria bacterium]|nr:hypothetical protein [Deltaproteobacteria bacterium]